MWRIVIHGTLAPWSFILTLPRTKFKSSKISYLQYLTGKRQQVLKHFLRPYRKLMCRMNKCSFRPLNFSASSSYEKEWWLSYWSRSQLSTWKRTRIRKACERSAEITNYDLEKRFVEKAGKKISKNTDQPLITTNFVLPTKDFSNVDDIVWACQDS